MRCDVCGRDKEVPSGCWRTAEDGHDQYYDAHCYQLGYEHAKSNSEYDRKLAAALEEENARLAELLAGAEGRKGNLIAVLEEGLRILALPARSAP